LRRSSRNKLESCFFLRFSKFLLDSFLLRDLPPWRFKVRLSLRLPPPSSCLESCRPPFVRDSVAFLPFLSEASFYFIALQFSSLFFEPPVPASASSPFPFLRVFFRFPPLDLPASISKPVPLSPEIFTVPERFSPRYLVGFSGAEVSIRWLIRFPLRLRYFFSSNVSCTPPPTYLAVFFFV